jgi:hypothetical protein
LWLEISHEGRQFINAFNKEICYPSNVSIVDMFLLEDTFGARDAAIFIIAKSYFRIQK